ncbi:TonB-dependent receptor plug domain-containing protein [Mucilaginibacter terrae]|uniref:TonB-dependent receptor plug domain-containing protein n=1 Tax=Mucilaginibacter terrae TaxID=1955052 RepID=UPI00363E6112
MPDQPVNNFDQALVGRLAGVQVLQTTGDPGRMATFRVRGTKSLTAGNSPLVVLDRIPLDAQVQVMELVNTNDIASSEALKDASAAAIYGSRGANGVVIITPNRVRKAMLKIFI